MRRILSRSSHRDSGFTLIELLMAIAIAAIVMTVVNLAFFQAHRAIESVGSQRETYQMVRVVMDRMMKDLSCAYVPATEGTGRTLGEEDISLYRFVGKDDSDGDVDLDSIHFTTAAELGLPGVMGGLAEVGYFLKEMEDLPGRYILIRSEDPLPHYGVSKSAREMEVAEDITSLNIVYLDHNDDEKDDWDLDQKLSLPRQVKVSVTFACGGEPLSFTGTAHLPLSELKLTVSEGGP
ncbi:MAG: type II secretion system protein [Desulfomonilia bacterium]|nr:type II secretion system GspH family protein [Deltaproteobacteria bacterium]MDX9761084.1 type II secretion system protein [Desulfomonilia bacterium]HPW68660.1 type II secretion system protein [Deltaproteobacteria bacterium]